MNNFSFSKGKGFLSLFFFLLFATSLVSAAVNIGSTNSGGVSIIQPISTVDYNLTNTNSSNFWDDLDAPLAAWTAVFNSSYALFSYNQTNLTWAFNQSNIQYNFNQSNIQYNFNQSNIQYNFNQSNIGFNYNETTVAYGMCMNNASYLTTYNVTYALWSYNQTLFTSSATDCSGTNKVTDVTLTNGVVSTICAADETGGGGGNPFNQQLNTTSNATFANITITRNSFFGENITIGNGGKLFASLNASTFPTTTCSGTDKVTAINSSGGVTCATDQTGSSSSASQMVSNIYLSTTMTNIGTAMKGIFGTAFTQEEITLINTTGYNEFRIVYSWDYVGTGNQNVQWIRVSDSSLFYRNGVFSADQDPKDTGWVDIPASFESQEFYLYWQGNSSTAGDDPVAKGYNIWLK